jgi:hypothetical protein
MRIGQLCFVVYGTNLGVEGDRSFPFSQWHWRIFEGGVAVPLYSCSFTLSRASATCLGTCFPQAVEATPLCFDSALYFMVGWALGLFTDFVDDDRELLGCIFPEEDIFVMLMA